MTKEIAGKLFSVVFISIFFIKMIISVAPVLAGHFDNEYLRSVILQLEIEDNSSEKIKESLLKAEWIEANFCLNVSTPFTHLESAKYIILDDQHVQTFYPIVLTPPPSI